MLLAVALPCGVLSAVAFGTATAVQHRAAHRDTGRADPRGVLRLVRDPRWLASAGGDFLGMLLQFVALATGPVLLIQPLLVLAVPVALPVGRLLGGPAPTGRDYAACVGILGSLAVFFALVGDPGPASPLAPAHALWATALAGLVGACVLIAVRTASSTVRTATYGAVAGAWFGLTGVLLNAVATNWRHPYLVGLGQPRVWIPLGCLALIGIAGYFLTQISFQVGALAVSFPANEATAPVVAVIVGAALLHERLPLSPAYVVAYLLCVAVAATGTVQLARGLSTT